MKALVSAAVLLVAAVPLAGCGPDRADADLFDGELRALNGHPAIDSRLRIELRSTDDNPATAERYFISGGCIDAGFYDKADGKFWSGLSPSKNGELVDHLRQSSVEPLCPPEDAARYVALTEIMRNGASLDLGKDGTTATFSNPSGASAMFAQDRGNIFD